MFIVPIPLNIQNTYTVACPPLSISPTPLLLPTRQFPHPEQTNPQRPHRITAFDVSPDGTQFSTGFYDGSIHLSSTASEVVTPPLRKIPKLHLSTVTALRFFPSSRVLLTAGADFTLTILPVEPPAESSTTSATPARTLRGHTRTITATAIISRGRNVLSAAKDGTVRLWDVSSGTQICSMGTGNGKYVPVLAMCVGDRGGFEFVTSDVDGGGATRDEREVGTADTLVFCTLQDGSFEIFDLGSKRSLFKSAAVGADNLTAITYSSAENLLVTGSSKGVVTVYSTRSISTLSSPLTSFARNEASIEDLIFTSAGGLAVATDDGLPFIAKVSEDGPGVEMELVGGDCEGVRIVRAREGELWTAGDDGVVRVY